MELDDKDLDILNHLQFDASSRRRCTEIAERIGLSIAQASRRIRRLEENGYITSYRAQLNHEKLGFGMIHYVMVGLEKQHKDYLKKFERHINGNFPNVIDSYRVASLCDYILKIATKDNKEFEAVLDNLSACPLIAKTNCVEVFGAHYSGFPISKPDSATGS